METFVIVPKNLFTKLASSDEVKWNNFALKRHMELEKKAKQKLQQEKNEDNLKNIHDFADLIQTVPNSAKSKTEKLLYELNSRHISWDPKTGRIFFKNKPMKTELNIGDIVKYFSRKTNKIPAHILKQILLFAERVNISRLNIVNPNIREKIYTKVPKNWYG